METTATYTIQTSDAEDHRVALDGWRYRAILQNLDEDLRSLAKHGSDTPTGGGLSSDQAANLRDKIRDLCADRGVSLWTE